MRIIVPAESYANRTFHAVKSENGTDSRICNETCKLVYDDSGKAYAICRRIGMDRIKLAGLRMLQEEIVDEAGWKAATRRWCDDMERRCVSELSAEVARVIWRRAGAIVASGLTQHLIERECRRAIPALHALVLLFLKPNEPRLGRLRKVFRYAYPYGPSKRSATRASAR